MFPVGLLYFMVEDYLNDTLKGRGGFYLVACIAALLLIAVTTYIQYNGTFLATYVESGVRRIAIAEQLRKIPLSFFGKKKSFRPYQRGYGGLCHNRNRIISLDS